MQYYINRETLTKQIINLYKSGGQFQKAANQIKTLLYDIDNINSELSKNPFKNLKTTNNGDSRIKNCIKYDLNGFCRLVTIQKKGVCAIVYLGKHEDVDKWLKENKGYELVVNEKTKEIKNLKITENIKTIEKKENFISEHEGFLFPQLKEHYLDIIEENINGKISKNLNKLNFSSSDEEILNILNEIEEESVQSLVWDVVEALREKDIELAKNRIEYFKQDYIKDITEENKVQLRSGEEFVKLDDFQPGDLDAILKSGFYDWMLFMHPAQTDIVEEDFNGPARLLGVSGSGKTSIIVNRAVRLAKKYSNEKILITTLNDSLAQLINDLIEIRSKRDKKEIYESYLSQIEVKSFWELTKELILQFESDSDKKGRIKEFRPITLKNEESYDDIWDEFYTLQENNDDAKVMFEVHASLSSRSINAKEYIKQEFDFIRSLSEEEDYLNIERTGRKIQLQKDFREKLLEAIEFWEKKMNHVGVRDQLGLFQELKKYKDKISPKYRAILIDELQDFGTSELAFLRKLVADGENDLFLCGDIAQSVKTKSQSIIRAGIQPVKYLKITKNYRNSREILEAASSVFQKNIDTDDFSNEDFNLLEPEYANFSTPKPFIRKSDSLVDEINNSLNYLYENLENNEKACIAICNISFFESKKLGKKLKLPVLDDNIELKDNNIFISDLEQTKGFEFDTVIILNANELDFPNPTLPREEWFREYSKLYVSMTRAKKELIISYNSEISSAFKNSKEFFNQSTKWSDYFNDLKIYFENEDLYNNLKQEENYLKNSTGLQYVMNSIGFSITCQTKLKDLVTGRNLTQNNLPEEWENMDKFISDLNRGGSLNPHMNRILGKNVFEELKLHFN